MKEDPTVPHSHFKSLLIDRYQNSSGFDTQGSAFFVFARTTGVTGGKGGLGGKSLEGTFGVTFYKGGRIIFPCLCFYHTAEFTI